MRVAWQRTRDAGIPFDAQWGDIDYMDRRLDFTVNPNEFAGLQEFVETIHEAGMRFVPLLDPAMCVWPDTVAILPRLLASLPWQSVDKAAKTTGSSN